MNNTIAILDRLVGRIIDQAEEISDLRRQLDDESAGTIADLQAQLDDARRQLMSIGEPEGAAAATKRRLAERDDNANLRHALDAAHADVRRWREGLDVSVAETERWRSAAELAEARAASLQTEVHRLTAAASVAARAEGVPKALRNQRVSCATDLLLDSQDLSPGVEVASPDLTGVWTIVGGIELSSVSGIEEPLGRLVRRGWLILQSTTRRDAADAPVTVLVADAADTLSQPPF